VAIGAAALIAPTATGRAFGFPDADANESAIVIGRMFGIREVAVGAFTLTACRDRGPAPSTLALNALVDGSDAIVVGQRLLSRRGGHLIQLLATAGPFVAWLWASRQQRRLHPDP
jgi:hypothetical protein